ncbi:MAG: HAMP domain-containing protein [Elusimicrobia bacterium]|jgi:HAMP domain-containing protein|nr:HAMP domain-containing protein [Elusimicrobiota bacterium]
MKIRSKVILYALFFAVASGGVMEWCYLNIRREEAAFLNGRRAMKTLAAVTDIDYFLVRQVRLLENYVLLGDESERLQLVQADSQMQQRLAEWEQAAQEGRAHGEELSVVQSIQESIRVPSNRIRGLIAKAKRTQAMALVEKEFTPASEQALKLFNEVKSRVESAKAESELRVLDELRRNHLGLMGGLALVALFGLGFLLALYRSVIRPIQKMRQWADRVARGEKGHAMAAFAGKNELTDLAQSIGEMAIQLTRPKASPPPSIDPKIPMGPSPEKPLPMEPPPLGVPIPTPPPGPSLESFFPVPTAPPVGVPMDSIPPTAPSAPPPKPLDDFEESVNEFREILTQLAGKVDPKSHRQG